MFPPLHGVSHPLLDGTFVPGTCVVSHDRTVHRGEAIQETIHRDPGLRILYLERALEAIPRLLGAIDRNPYHPTHGCLDRQYWHYRTSDFPSEMYQEGVLPLAMVYATRLPGNVWYRSARVRELAIAGIRFAARSSHADGSCDDYYPFERALGAAVFSLQAAARAYQILRLDDAELVGWFERRARWLINHDESGHLANHQALAALALCRVGEITGKKKYCEAAFDRIQKTLGWQNEEGWFEEYGGADPGYQTVTIDCLAKLRRLCGDERLDEPLRRAVAFARLFLHPDDSYGGEYGSRGTYHFYPHGMELLAGCHAEAADLAEGFLHSLAAGSDARFADDRMFAHQLANFLEAYHDWAPLRPTSTQAPSVHETRYLREAQILIRRGGAIHTIVSAARGGVFKHFSPGKPAITDTGLILETTRGREAVSQTHERTRHVEITPQGLVVQGPLYWDHFETATPLKQALLHVGMWAGGRWCRTLVRRTLQRRLITGRRPAPVRLVRELVFQETSATGPALRVIDKVELLDPRLRVRRMSFGTDHQTAYVAASGVYQKSVLAPWTDLAHHVERLNTERRVTIVREYG